MKLQLITGLLILVGSMSQGTFAMNFNVKASNFFEFKTKIWEIQNSFYSQKNNDKEPIYEFAKANAETEEARTVLFNKNNFQKGDKIVLSGKAYRVNKHTVEEKSSSEGHYQRLSAVFLEKEGWVTKAKCIYVAQEDICTQKSSDKKRIVRDRLAQTTEVKKEFKKAFNLTLSLGLAYGAFSFFKIRLMQRYS
jgi:hypothetical protein